MTPVQFLARISGVVGEAYEQRGVESVRDPARVGASRAPSLAERDDLRARPRA
jgi:hypothetical protein